MGSKQLEALLGKPQGVTTERSAHTKAVVEKRFFYGPVPTHYTIGIMPPVRRTVHFGLWSTGPSVRLDNAGNVQTIYKAMTPSRRLRRLW